MSAKSLLQPRNTALFIDEVPKASGVWVPEELLIVIVGSWHLDLGVSLPWQQQVTVNSDLDGDSFVLLALQLEYSPREEAIAASIVEVLDRHSLVVVEARTALLQNHSFTVSIGIIEVYAQFISDEAVELAIPLVEVELIMVSEVPLVEASEEHLSSNSSLVDSKVRVDVALPPHNVVDTVVEEVVPVVLSDQGPQVVVEEVFVVVGLDHELLAFLQTGELEVVLPVLLVLDHELLVDSVVTGPANYRCVVFVFEGSYVSTQVFVLHVVEMVVFKEEPLVIFTSERSHHKVLSSSQVAAGLKAQNKTGVLLKSYRFSSIVVVEDLSVIAFGLSDSDLVLSELHPFGNIKDSFSSHHRFDPEALLVFETNVVDI